MHAFRIRRLQKLSDFRKESHYDEHNHACTSLRLVVCNKLANHTAFSG